MRIKMGVWGALGAGLVILTCLVFFNDIRQDAHLLAFFTIQHAKNTIKVTFNFYIIHCTGS
jgi:hypothetical protein